MFKVNLISFMLVIFISSLAQAQSITQSCDDWTCDTKSGLTSESQADSVNVEPRSYKIHNLDVIQPSVLIVRSLKNKSMTLIDKGGSCHDLSMIMGATESLDINLDWSDAVLGESGGSEMNIPETRAAIQEFRLQVITFKSFAEKKNSNCNPKEDKALGNALATYLKGIQAIEKALILFVVIND